MKVSPSEPLAGANRDRIGRRGTRSRPSKPAHSLWLLGGVDHLFVDQRRDYFLSLQLRFTDEDLKTILPFAGGVTGR